MADDQFTVSDGVNTVTLEAPLTVSIIHEPQRFSSTCNGTWVATDIPRCGPTRLKIEGYNIAMDMGDLNRFWDWFHNRTVLALNDLASGNNPDTDAYYQTFVGYIAKMPEIVESPRKMKPDKFIIEFVITEATTPLVFS